MKLMQMLGKLPDDASVMWQVSVSHNSTACTSTERYVLFFKKKEYKFIEVTSDSHWKAAPHHSKILCLGGKNCDSLSLTLAVAGSPLLSPPLLTAKEKSRYGSHVREGGRRRAGRHAGRRMDMEMAEIRR